MNIYVSTKPKDRRKANRRYTKQWNGNLIIGVLVIVAISVIALTNTWVAMEESKLAGTGLYRTMERK